MAGQIAEMKGNPDGRLVVRLFEGDADIRRAAQALHDAGYARESISTFLYQNSIRPGQILMLVRTDNNRAADASVIMRQVNLARA